MCFRCVLWHASFVSADCVRLSDQRVHILWSSHFHCASGRTIALLLTSILQAPMASVRPARLINRLRCSLRLSTPSSCRCGDARHAAVVIAADARAPADMQMPTQSAASDAAEHAGHANGVSTAANVCFIRQRRQRIVTLPAKVARTRRQIFESCDADVTAVLLTHKALRVAAADGIGEARLMLTDWLAALVAHASEAFPSGSGATPDPSLAACTPLSRLPRAVYGLLCSPLLCALRVHPDVRAHAALLAAALPPDAHACLLYPRLGSWRDADTPDVGEHALTRSAMAIAAAPLFVLDGFTTVVVYAWPTPAGAQQQPFPPLHKVRRRLFYTTHVS